MYYRDKTRQLVVVRYAERMAHYLILTNDGGEAFNAQIEARTIREAVASVNLGKATAWKVYTLRYPEPRTFQIEQPDPVIVET